jgi:hypothetical protein
LINNNRRALLILNFRLGKAAKNRAAITEKEQNKRYKNVACLRARFLQFGVIDFHVSPIRHRVAKEMPCSGVEPSDVVVISEKSKRIRVLLMAGFASFQMQFAHGRPL